MRLVVQRVRSARVDVESPDGAWACVGAIGAGLVALCGLEAGDTDQDAAWCAHKLAGLRVFEDEGGRMNRGLDDLAPAQGDGDPPGVLLVPNFTLAGDCRKGRRPSFDRAMAPERASPMFEAFVETVRTALDGAGVSVATGVFRASMRVTLVNDGPVTLILDARDRPNREQPDA